MAETVEILDSIMGSNKTNGILKWIDSNPNEKYIYLYLIFILSVDFDMLVSIIEYNCSCCFCC